MSYEDALQELQSEFGKKQLLTPKDIAPYIGRSPNAQAVMRSRDRFPIPVRMLGGVPVVSIFDLARYIGGDPVPSKGTKDKAASAGSSLTPSGRRRFAQPTNDRTKPFRRPPKLDLTVRAFARQVQETERHLAFQRELLARLREIAMRADLDGHRPANPRAAMLRSRRPRV